MANSDQQEILRRIEKWALKRANVCNQSMWAKTEPHKFQYDPYSQGFIDAMNQSASFAAWIAEGPPEK